MTFKKIYKLIVEQQAPNAPKTRRKFVVDAFSEEGETKTFETDNPLDAIKFFIKYDHDRLWETTIIAPDRKNAIFFWEYITNNMSKIINIIKDDQLLTKIMSVLNQQKPFSWDIRDGSLHPFSYQLTK